MARTWIVRRLLARRPGEGEGFEAGSLSPPSYRFFFFFFVFFFFFFFFFFLLFFLLWVEERSCFETFPFPWPPGQEPADDPRVRAIAQAAAELVRLRDAWLNPPDASDAELKKRTLTNLYNARPTWLDIAPQETRRRGLRRLRLAAVLSDEEILERLLALNLARAGGK